MTTKTDNTLLILEKMIGYKPTLGTMLTAIRESEGISQIAFAKLLKITPQKLCDIEKGRRFISPKTAEKFAKKLGDSTEYFVIRCLQDELERNKINIRLRINHESIHYHGHARAFGSTA
jgi:transcriptional regulator with XRE-family HTH domain